MTDKIYILTVNAHNVSELGIYCIRNRKAPGFIQKMNWFKSKFNKGILMKIAINETGKQLGFIEYISSEKAWRPVIAKNYFFIQCIGVFSKEARDQNIGTSLLRICEKEAMEHNKSGVCVMTSDGPWMANRSVFEKNEYRVIDQLGRYQLLYRKFNELSPDPRLIDWTSDLGKYKGWNLIYADQCPWHEKSIKDLRKSAKQNGIKLKVTRLKSPAEAQNAPTGFGTYSLIKDGQMLADHYLSKTRFENILKKELKA